MKNIEQIEGKNPVIEALKGGRRINSIMIAKDIERGPAVNEILATSKAKGIPVEWVEPSVIRSRARTAAPQGLIAFSAPKGYASLDDLLMLIKAKKEPALLVLLDGLEDPHNLGAILRTADACGVHGVVIPERRSVGLTEAVSKVSAGAVEYVPVARVNNLNNAIRDIKAEGISVIGVDGDAEKKYTDIDLSGPCAVVIGGEGKGISRLVRENCDEAVMIPMKGRISSLNASVAASIIMYEIVRQRSR